VNFTTEVVKPMQDELQALLDRVSKNEKELTILRQFEKSQSDHNLRNSNIMNAVQGDIA